MTVIDLGRADHDGADPPAPFRLRPLRRRERRRLLVVVVAVFCVLTATGSARPDPRGLVQLWDVPFALDANQYQLSGDDVFVLDRSGDRRLTARDARTGAVHWSTVVGESSELAGVEAGALLMAASLTAINHVEPDGSPFTREFSRETVAVDAATGRELWRQPGEIAATVGDRVLLLEWDEVGERSRRIRMVRLRDGGTVWSRDGAGAVSWTVDMTPGVRVDRLFTVSAGGLAEVIALTDGSVVTTGTLAPPGVGQTEDHSVVTVQGRQLYQDRTGRGRTTTTAYDIDTLRQLWTIDEPAGGSFGCGPVLCLLDGESISGHDRATGALLWRLTKTAAVYPLTGGRLLSEDEHGARHTVLEGATGRRLAELGRGKPVWDSQGRLTYLIAGTLQPPGRTSVSSIDPESAEVVLRGTVAPAQTCRNERDLLICVTEDNRLAVTDVG
ncbi:PQQ-binding-like beta-propeller repeat protein [Actinoplanes sp. NPDC026623]|uniref:outer membrane protein assembly factor BamB family protein n=1 Tax=Actinoplanes sp. NPDC026623 TaxID=3155610 RepID=UPI0033CFDA6D